MFHAGICDKKKLLLILHLSHSLTVGTGTIPALLLLFLPAGFGSESSVDPDI